MNKIEYNKHWYIITIVAILILFGFNGNISTLGLDEAMYTTSSFEMVESSNMLVPQFNYEPFFDKPPMVYWLQSIPYSLFDDFLGSKRLSDNTIIPFDTKLMLFRVPASLICLLFLWLIMFTGKKLYNLKSGIYSGYAFLLCPLTCILGKLAIMDMILSFFISFSLIIILFVYLKKINSYYIVLAWIFCGLAFMTKGPIALVLIGLIYLIYFIINKSIKQLFTLPNLIGFIVFLGIILPWFIKMQIVSNGTFWYEFFIHQNLQRAAGQDFGHNYPIYSYIFIIAIGMIPWSFYIIPSMLKFKFNNPNHKHDTFFTIWAIVVFLFFTALVGKLPGYIYPLFAPCSLLVGKFFAEYKFSKGLKIWGLFATIFSIILGVVFIVALFLLNYQTIYAKIIFFISGLFMIIFSIFANIEIIKGKNPIKFYKTQMIGFLMFFVIGLFLITTNPKNGLDEIDNKYDLGTSSYNIAREFNVRNLPNHIAIYAYNLSPFWISYPLNFERPVKFVDNEKLEEMINNLPDKYLIIAKDELNANIKGERIENHPLFTGKKHKIIFIKNY